MRVSTPAPVAHRVTVPPDAGFQPSTEHVAQPNPQLRDALRPAFAAEGLRLDSVHLDGRRAVIRLANQRHDVLPRAVGRAARILTHALPPGVEDIVVIPMHDGVVGTAITIRRSDLERFEHDPAGSAGLWAGARLSDPLGFPGVGRVWQPLAEGRDRFVWSVSPYLALSFFDPTMPVRADMGIEGVFRYNFAENLSANLTMRQRLAGNVADGTIGPDSPGYPRVRTLASLYSSSRPTVERATLDYTLRPGRDLYGRVTVGWLERMYAGVSTELLWSPPNSRLSFGVELNHVAQRDPGSVLGVNALRITTGHASAYWDIGHGFHGQLDVGRYLAGDTGATLRLERVFANGIRVGAYATLTDMPFSVFGEGSFDRGITLTLPLTALTGSPSRARYSTTIQSLTRDGGARLNVPGRLYPTIQESRRQALHRSWGVVLQ